MREHLKDQALDRAKRRDQYRRRDQCKRLIDICLQWNDLLLALLARDLKMRYQRSAIGLGWSLMRPLSQLLIFSLIFRHVLPLNIPYYTTFVFSGVLAWGWLSTAVPAAATSITGSSELVRRPGFPIGILPVVAVITQAVHLLLALPLLFIISFIETGGLALSIAALPLVFLAQALFTMGLSYLVAIAHVHFRDTQHLVGVFLMLGFYLTPVFYSPLKASEPMALIHTWNPMAWILEGYRAIFVEHAWPPVAIYWKTALISLPMLLIGIWLVERGSARLVDEL
ncbi:ABC transporter [Rhizobium sp. L9]|uniref:ABC transporter permease n=1 Tax=Rhizobium sp. L9 TaxID=1340738 RepID=UPI000BE8C9E6|nr:ABC transporter permease [Rhizobium sp. L9]PDT32145.1 ABC transporter [Rhizobium sp. L9]